jgi:hypothetical protein
MSETKFDLPRVRSEFLVACADYLHQEPGVSDIVPIAKHRNEAICATWDIGITENFPSFDTLRKRHQMDIHRQDKNDRE